MRQVASGIIVLAVITSPVGAQVAKPSVPTDWTTRVKVTLSTAQEAFVQYEPISLRILETNHGGELPAIPLLGSTAQLYAKQGQQAERVLLSGSTEGDAFGTRIPKWASGMSRDWLMMLIHSDGGGVGRSLASPLTDKFITASPGTLTFRYELSLDRKTRVSSNSVAITVLPPTAEDQALLQYVGNPANLLFLYEGTEPPAGTSKTDFLEDVISRFPRSSFAPYALLKLALIRGSDSAYPTKKEWTDYEAAYRAANEVLERFPKSAVAPQAAYYVAHMMRRLGRAKELEDRSEELRRIVGEDLQHSICLRLTLEGKDFGCEGPIQ